MVDHERRGKNNNAVCAEVHTVPSAAYSAPIKLLGKKAQTVPTTDRIIETVMIT